MFLSKRTSEVIDFLARGERTLTQIQKELNVSKPMALKLMKDIMKKGMVTSKMRKTKTGREKVFSLASFSFLISYDPETRGLICFNSDQPFDIGLPLLNQVKQTMFIDPIKEYVLTIKKKFKKRDYAMILFGSVARGDGTRKSDIDLLFLSDSWSKKEKDRVKDVLAGAVHKAGTQAIPHFWTIDEISRKEDNLTRSVRNEGIILFINGEVGDIWQTLKRYSNISI